MTASIKYVFWPILAFICSIAAIAGLSIGLATPLIIISAAVSAWAALASLLQIRQLQADIKEADRNVALFIRGQLDARVPPVHRKDNWGIFKYRLNNLLDILDVACRGNNAAIDGLGNAEYIEKLKTTQLFATIGSPSDDTAPETADEAPFAEEALELTTEVVEEGDAQPAETQSDATAESNDNDEAFAEDTDDSSTESTEEGGGATTPMRSTLGQLITHLEETGQLLLNDEDTNAIVARIEGRQAAERAQKNVASVAAAAEELSASIQEIASRVSDSSRIAEEAVGHARKGNMVIHELNEASTKIGDVVDLIHDIAGQTNLLALNATIEAARAGEAGKGFSVVAGEVKDLADQTSEATDEIALQVNNIQNATKQTIDAIRQISKTITTMSEIATMIASAVEQQSAATGEISHNIQQAAKETAAVADQYTHDATEQQKAEQLRQQLEILKGDLHALSSSLNSLGLHDAA